MRAQKNGCEENFYSRYFCGTRAYLTGWQGRNRIYLSLRQAELPKEQPAVAGSASTSSK
jgi:hypothetical protein